MGAESQSFNMRVKDILSSFNRSGTKSSSDTSVSAAVRSTSMQEVSPETAPSSYHELNIQTEEVEEFRKCDVPKDAEVSQDPLFMRLRREAAEVVKYVNYFPVPVYIRE